MSCSAGTALPWRGARDGAGRTDRRRPRSRELRPDTDRLLQAVTPQTRAVIIASPNNPVGRYLPRAEL